MFIEGLRVYTFYCSSILHSPVKDWLIDDDGTKQRHKLSPGLAGSNTFDIADFLAPFATWKHRTYFQLPGSTKTPLQICLAKRFQASQWCRHLNPNFSWIFLLSAKIKIFLILIVIELQKPPNIWNIFNNKCYSIQFWLKFLYIDINLSVAPNYSRNTT